MILELFAVKNFQIRINKTIRDNPRIISKNLYKLLHWLWQTIKADETVITQERV